MEAFRSSLDLVTLELVADPVFEALFGEHCALLLTSLEFPMLWRCNRQHTALPFPPSGVYTTYAHFGDLYQYWSRNITSLFSENFFTFLLTKSMKTAIICFGRIKWKETIMCPENWSFQLWPDTRTITSCIWIPRNHVVSSIFSLHKNIKTLYVNVRYWGI